ncbi:Auxin-responsive protein SAUR41 [Heracleum sosnowskyi]|uniref:Auxin-responsive protein SAUR41 n=1 Tax=Heracleum sosnowskyi TaxID=360622 RepID=A0AAD8INB0_9APIA|nr:Auxin-responsive protein SAUR41 [Heracleum sosnowskyi]
MKKLLNRFSRVADSSHYSQLSSDARPRRTATFLSLKLGRSTNGVPAGHLPVYVGQEMQRYIVSTTLLGSPIFVQLLNKVAEEYGYQLEGVLHIPCNFRDFETLLTAATRDGVITPEIENILNNL